MAVESDLSVVWSPRLLYEIDMIISKLANIYFMSWKPIENFFEDPEVTVVTCETPFFEVITKGRLCLGV